jgi:putative PEP-CTERM system histidine kinase
MTIAMVLAFSGAALGGALAFGSALRARGSLARWSFVAGMTVLTAEAICRGLSAFGFPPERMYQLQLWQLVVLSFLPGTWLLFSLTYARGNARDSLVRWGLPLAGTLLLPPLLAIGFRGGLIASIQQAGQGLPWIVRLGWSGIALQVLLLGGSVMILMNLERTYRAAVGTMLWRIKFILLAVGVLFVVRAYTSSQALLFRAVDQAVQDVDSGAFLVAALFTLRAFFRAGYFDSEVYPSQSVLQGSLTVFLAGIYLLVVGVFAKVVTRLGGDNAFALKTFVVLISLVVLAALLQSDRIRLQLRRFVSRNFQRPLYDYRTVWTKFTECTASRVEQTDLCRSLAGLIAEMFQSLSVSIWLVDEKKESLILAASTSITKANGSAPKDGASDAAALIAHFETRPDPVDFETIDEEWADALRQRHPLVFPNGGSRLCIPLTGRGQVLGLITMGDRVGGAGISQQGLDVLRCIGDHTAASLLNTQLSQRLLQAKEFEAFQTMATFFVHDLKNAASTLNLMLQNLPVHFDDPVFREDAWRGISKTVAHINNLVGRLSALRHELKIQPVESDLSDVVARALARLDGNTGTIIDRNLPPLPGTLLDQEQVQNVVTNLVLNAIDAVSGAGSVSVTTSQDIGWSVLTVADTGCGMSPEFLSHSLFRPFQSTKKSGLGIGMFQSKMIVEAHGGRITATSEPAKGTVFRVFLPARKAIQ